MESREEQQASNEELANLRAWLEKTNGEIDTDQIIEAASKLGIGEDAEIETTYGPIHVKRNKDGFATDRALH